MAGISGTMSVQPPSLRAHNDLDVQRVDDGNLDVITPPNGLSSPLEGLSKTMAMVFQRDLFDGRLINLNGPQIKEIKEISLEQIAKTQCSQVFATTKVAKGFNKKLVLKELYIGRDEIEKMRSITNEKLASRILHFGIVPLLAYHDALRTDQYFYFVSPYFEGGDLLAAIKEDTNTLFPYRMGHKTRLKIIFQVASAITYMHTPVKGFRNDVLHLDIKSSHIVLDLMNNARLIGFGLAREMTEPNAKPLIISDQLTGTVGYFPTKKSHDLTKCHDYHNFGVVIRELLTGRSPVERIHEQTLSTMSNFMLKERIQILAHKAFACFRKWYKDRSIWKKSELSNALLDLARRSVESLGQHAAADTFQFSEMLTELNTLMREEGAEKWTRFSTNEGEKCEVCIVNNAADESEFLEHHKTCVLPIKVCASCMKNSFLNPIICHTCENKLQPLIGQNWGAILIAGNDKNRYLAHSFKRDVHRLKCVITSRRFPVMCIREESIEVVTPENPGKEDLKMWGKVERAFKHLNTQNLKTLLVVYSGQHGFPNKNHSCYHLESVTGSKIVDNEGIYKLSEKELMKDVEFGNEIQKLTTVDKVVIFEDRCHGDAVMHALKGKTVVQFNNSTTTSHSLMDLRKNESRYFGAMIKALTATEETKDELYQHTECNTCVKIANILFTESFLTLDIMHIFISKYIAHGLQSFRKKEFGCTSFSAQNISDKDYILAYRCHSPDYVQFKIRSPNCDEEKTESIYLNEFENVQKLREYLFIRILGDDDCTNYPDKNADQRKTYAAVVSIQVEHGPREVHLKEIESLEQASSAWVARMELIAQIRNVEKIDFQYDVADTELPKDVENIFKTMRSVSQQLCCYDSSEETERFIVDRNDLQRCVSKLEELREIAPKLSKTFFFNINQSLDHINTVLHNKHEDVSNVKAHIVFPKNNAEGFAKFWPLIYYHLERASALP